MELTTSLSTAVNLSEHCCLADFGIRLSTLFFGIGASDGEAASNGDAAEPHGGAGGGSSELTDGLGDLPEPGHLSAKGP